ncbi:MAG: rod shape-determining protein RodA [Alphaproteobacteria bacterium]|uniref:Peptidoglycan glycosyltransferase RodA n=1 Tax=Candidatus Nitrobium versatile TaxID=2884831 RepID=A0A953J9M6_9BACT|nr:rod shape-determining protein RodA [Candidatus Nitrobium versatile]
MLQINRRLSKNFDWITLILITSLSLIGIMTIYSATRPLGGGEHSDFYLRQILWLNISIVALFIMVFFDYKWLYRFSYPLYALGLLLLVIVLFAGKTSMGAQRWIHLGFFSFQPSEFFRMLFIMGFSAYLTNGNPIQNGMSAKAIVLFALFPLALLIKQPDLGTAILLFSLFVTLTVVKGISRKIITIVLVIGLISVPFVGHIFWEGLKDYQKNRLIAFMDPDVDPAGIGYHINQSKISIGSGGVAGKGYLKGTQGPLRFLPEKHTDFIFAVFAEEWGFLGCAVLLCIYALLFLRGLDTAYKAKDEFGRLVAIGVTAMFFVYFCVNIGMTLGMMPVVGVPLPFVSYGGTALLSNYIAAGILMNIRTRRLELFHP